MMAWTDRHERYFLRLISPHAKLYTEMVTAAALLHGDAAALLAFDPSEQPLALQLGGSEPQQLAAAARLGAAAGYQEINLNVGCPSPRVSRGRFGACLMQEPQLVADCVAAMRAAVDVPVTVKCRLGVDELDSYAALVDFITTVQRGGCDTFIVHARKAWLQGLSPKQNRDVPPLDYARVYQLKQDFPQLTFIINGGIRTVAEVRTHLQQVDGVMLGREAYHNPWILAEIEAELFTDARELTRHAVLISFLPYIEAMLAAGIRLSAMSRHLLGLFQGLPGSRRWRRHISEHGHRAGAGIEVIIGAMQYV